MKTFRENSIRPTNCVEPGFPLDDDTAESFVLYERENPYHFFPANQQKVNSEIYSIPQYDLTENGCDWQAMVRELYDIV